MHPWKIHISGRPFDFGPVVADYGEDVATALAQSWQSGAVAYAPSTWRSWGWTLIRLLKWLAAEAHEPESAAKGAFSAIRDLLTRKPDPSVLRGAIELWRDRPATQEEEYSAVPLAVKRQRTLEQATGALRLLSGTGLLPPIGRVRPAFRGQNSGNNIPSLAELTRPGEIAPTEWRHLIALGKLRLDQLRSIAVQALQAEVQRVRRGRHLATCVLSPAANEAELFTRLLELGLARDGIGRAPLPISAAARSAAEAEVLAYAIAIREGQVATSSRHLRRQIAELGGLRHLRHCIEPSLKGLLAAQLVVLIDTGLNVSTSDELAADPVVGTIRRGFVRIDTVSGVKLRAAGKVVESSLLEVALPTKRGDRSMSGREAIVAWRELSAPFRARALTRGESAADYLWALPVHVGEKETLRRVGPDFGSLRRTLSDELSADAILDGLVIQRRMIRPTVLQIRHAEGGFDHLATAVEAGHSSPITTRSYIGRKWLAGALDEKISSYLKVLERSLADDITDIAARIGVTEAEWVELKDKSSDTGLGFLCATPFQSPQPDVPHGQQCMILERCADCSSRRFVPTPKALRDLVVVRRSLRDQQPAFEATNPIRWQQAWLPLLALVEAIASRLSTTPRRFDLQRAEEEVAGGLKQGSIRLVPLF